MNLTRKLGGGDLSRDEDEGEEIEAAESIHLLYLQAKIIL